MLDVTLVAAGERRLSVWFPILKRAFPSILVGRQDYVTMELDEQSGSPNRIQIQEGRLGSAGHEWMEFLDISDSYPDELEPDELANIRLLVAKPTFTCVRYSDLRQLSRALSLLADQEIWVDDGMGLLLPIGKFVDLISTNPDGYMDRFRGLLK